MDRNPMTQAGSLPKPKALTDDEEQIAELMVYGLPNDETIRGKDIKAGWPLTLEQAASFIGYRLKRARTHLNPMPEFRALLGSHIADLRRSEKARNLARAVAIRDDPGEGLAADRTVQLKAIGVIEGTEGKASVVVNVNQTNNTATISPGYVIRLRERQSPEALPSPMPEMIEAQQQQLEPAIIEHEAE